MAACLAAGPAAVASFRSAAILHGLPGVPPWLEVTVARPRQVEVSGLIVHRTTLLGVEDRCVVSLIPATTAARTVIDLAAELPAERLGVLVDYGLASGAFTLAELESRLEAVRSKGRKGVLMLETLLWEREGGRFGGFGDFYE